MISNQVILLLGFSAAPTIDAEFQASDEKTEYITSDSSTLATYLPKFFQMPILFSTNERGPLKEEEILPLERFDESGVCTAGTAMKNIEALAKRCRLAGLKPPPEKAVDYCNAAGTFFAQHAYGEVEIEVHSLILDEKIRYG